MPFGFTNAPVVFQHLMNDIFREYMDEFVVVYLDDILTFSKDQETHDKHVRLVFVTLREHGLYAKMEKCEFDKSLVAFLGYVISPDGIFMDKSKVETIQCWLLHPRSRTFNASWGLQTSIVGLSKATLRSQHR